MRAFTLLLLGACSFTHGALPAVGGDAANDSTAVDAMPDAEEQQSSCVARWLAGPTFTTPAPLDSINAAGSIADPFVSADELTIYVAIASDIWVATRTSVSANFGSPAKDSSLSSSANDTKVSLTADGLTAFLNSARPGSQNSDIWRATRAVLTDPFVVDSMYLAAVNTSGEQWDPHVSADGLRLYLAPSGSPQTIAVATRAMTTENFGPAQTITPLNSMMVDNDPTLSADELVIVFASNRNSNRNLWYAVRATANVAFGTPMLVPTLNMGTDDSPHLSADGCRLYFVSDRAGGVDLYVTTVM